VTTRSLQHIVVVGGSLAGLRSCEEFRRQGYDGQLSVVSGEARVFYDRPPLSKQFLAGTFDELRIALTKSEKLDELDVSIQLGVRARALDIQARELVLDDESTISFDGLVIATGATPRHLGEPSGLDGVFVLRTMADAPSLEKGDIATRGQGRCCWRWLSWYGGGSNSEWSWCQRNGHRTT